MRYLRDVVPHTGEKINPYEAMFGKNPVVSLLRVFGCRAWVLFPAMLQPNLEPRAVAVASLGYGIGQKG